MNWEGYSEDLKSFEQHSVAEFNLKWTTDQAEWGTQIHRLYEGESIFAHLGVSLQLHLWVRALLVALCVHQMRLKKTFPRISA